MHSLLLRTNKNPNVRHKTLSLKETIDETVTANNWQTRVLRNQFLTKRNKATAHGVCWITNLPRTPSPAFMWSQKNTINLSCTPFLIPVTFCRCQWHTIYCPHSKVFGKQVMPFSSVTNYTMKSMFLSTTTAGPSNPVISEQLKSQVQWVPILSHSYDCFPCQYHNTGSFQVT